MDRADITIIGAGVIGLAIARSLAMAGREVVLLEQENRFGCHSSSRNSEVIHAGLYYPTGSLKARFCVDGSRRLYDYCAARHIEARHCGKLIVGNSPAQRSAIEAIAGQAAVNGVTGLAFLTRGEIAAKEPCLRAAIALFSPNTGILDSHGYMLSLLGEATERGAVIAYNSRVSALAATGRGIAISLNDEIAPCLLSRHLINAAGLGAPAIAGLLGGAVPRSWLARGNYFTLTGRAPFRHLIYPAPEEGGLGIHLTFDLAGQARFGPDVEWIDRLDYRVDPARAEIFLEQIRDYWPDLEAGRLHPDYAGIRPKITGPGMKAADFRIDGVGDHGIAGMINLFGIESPGLTASLALADHVRDMVFRESLLS